MTIIIYAICAIVNILVATDSNNPEAWANWLSAGFCLGMMVVAIAMKFRR